MYTGPDPIGKMEIPDYADLTAYVDCLAPTIPPRAAGRLRGLAALVRHGRRRRRAAPRSAPASRAVGPRPGVRDVRRPVPQRLAERILERSAPGLHRDHARTEELHAKDVQSLAGHVLLAHSRNSLMALWDGIEEALNR